MLTGTGKQAGEEILSRFKIWSFLVSPLGNTKVHMEGIIQCDIGISSSIYNRGQL